MHIICSGCGVASYIMRNTTFYRKYIGGIHYICVYVCVGRNFVEYAQGIQYKLLTSSICVLIAGASYV